jgi:hypothetical protein
MANVKVINFKKDGPQLYAKISSMYAQPGDYAYRLWEGTSNTLVEEKNGNFLNPEDDVYALPTQNEINDKRIVQFIVTLAITPPIKDYGAKLEILQGEETIGELSYRDSQSSGFVSVNLFVQLNCQ